MDYDGDRDVLVAQTINMLCQARQEIPRPSRFELLRSTQKRMSYNIGRKIKCERRRNPEKIILLSYANQ